VKVRRAARVVMLDPDDRLLLLHLANTIPLVVDGRVSPPTCWITVGGGLEGDESFGEAARREVFEETGIRDFRLGPALWDRETAIELDGEPMTSLERFFAAWTDQTDVVFDHHVPAERDQIKDFRWWTGAELADPAGAPLFFPERLPELFAASINLRPSE
jgi:8-oxo-dGTP pyrophosphatase MutT (NUDIX family)